jgi:hypothetical protein
LAEDFLVAALELAFFAEDIADDGVDDGRDDDERAVLVGPGGGRGRGRDWFEWGWLEVKRGA